MKLLIKHKNKKIKLEVHKCNFLEKIIGLMFSRRENARALLFEFKKPTRMTIHSLFVFFPFFAIWLDSRGKVVEIQKIPSWRLSVKPNRDFTRLIEIPISRRYSKILKKLI